MKSKSTEKELCNRALAAYFKGNGDKSQPDKCEVRIVGGLAYIVLENQTGILAVYRHRSTGLLRRLTRWPQEVEAAKSGKELSVIKLDDLDPELLKKARGVAKAQGMTVASYIESIMQKAVGSFFSAHPTPEDVIKAVGKKKK